ncbi:IS1 family transposase [Pseudanabaena sp. FACHB-1998]|uniref:IS1 family transposase n=1 Tax=Pseudanabaena sp. FACHB-1998 TaxID=2692858 RepID=UPI001680D562|nr:IS1 family transposase [Pseudanabaena sp. FACHB-1998]MBD2179506.1 IS1 family transposase [Pseudanabaena sp. FACHB-1998]
MARKDIKTLSLYPSDELMQSLKEFKDLGDYKSLSAAAIAILSQHFTNPQSTLPSTVQSTLPSESNTPSTVLTTVQSTVLDELTKEIKALNSRVEALESQSTLPSTVQSTLPSESNTPSTVLTTVQSTVLDEQNIVETESLPIIDAIENINTPPITSKKQTDTTALVCPNCSAVKPYKNGLDSRSGKQKYKCKKCSKQWVSE